MTIRNRELSQFGSFIYVDNSSQEIGIATETFPYVGIGTTNPTHKFTVVGDTNINGSLTASSYFLNGSPLVSAEVQVWETSGSNAYRSTGNVGIGTASPTSKLTVVGDVTASSFKGSAQVGIGTSGIYLGLTTQFNFVGSGITIIPTYNSITGITTLVFSAAVGYPGGSTGQLQYNNSGTLGAISNSFTDGTNLRISGIMTASSFKGSAQVGVGTSDSYLGLTTQFNFVGIGITITPQYNSVTGITTLIFSGGSGGGAISYPISLSNGGTNASLVASNGGIVYSTSSEFAILSGTGSAGQVLVSGSSAAPSWTSTLTLSDLTVNNGLNVTGVITCTDLNSTSDINLKENIQTVTNALDIVKDIRGVKFEWKNNGKKSLGVIAQEIEQVLPELTSDNNNTKTVNYNGLIGILIEAIKELSEEIELLKRKST